METPLMEGIVLTAIFPGERGLADSIRAEDNVVRVAEWLGRWTCEQWVASLNPGLPAVECNLGKLLTHMCLCHQAV